MKGNTGVQQRPFTASIARGEGLVARFGDVVMYVADTSSEAAPLIAAAELVADVDYPGNAIAEHFAPITFRSGSSVAFGVIAPTADGLLVLLRGNIAARVEAADGFRDLSGARAFTWVDEAVRTGAEAVSIAVGAVPGVQGCAQTDLRGGVIPGGGFVVARVGVGEGRVSHANVDLELTQRMSPDETAAAQGAAPAEAAASPVKTPVKTPRSRRRFAETVVAPAVSQAVTPPSLSETSAMTAAEGALVSDDGAVYPLDRAYVIGRDPLADSAVRNAQASPIVVHNDRYISRVHAHVYVDGAKVYVCDAMTPGGTFIAPPGGKGIQIKSIPTELKQGWSIQVGDQTFTYRS